MSADSIGCPCAYCWHGWTEDRFSIPFGTISFNVFPEMKQPMVLPFARFEYGVCTACGSSHAHEADIFAEEST